MLWFAVMFCSQPTGALAASAEEEAVAEVAERVAPEERVAVMVPEAVAEAVPAVASAVVEASAEECNSPLAKTPLPLP